VHAAVYIAAPGFVDLTPQAFANMSVLLFITCKRPRAAGALALWLTCGAAGAEQVTRYVCTFDDGAVRVLASDLTQAFPLAARQCRQVEVDAAQLMRLGAQRPAAVLFRVPRHAAASTRMTLFPGLTPALAAQVDQASERARVDPLLVAALVSVESRWRSDARSPKGALGLMQLMPGTARAYGVEHAQTLLDPQVNLAVGTRHLRTLQDRYGARVDLVLAAYNAGDGAVQRNGGRVPPYAETQAYVQNILALLRQAQDPGDQ
jgi:soluble lytic murein transglycosylase-like protein